MINFRFFELFIYYIVNINRPIKHIKRIICFRNLIVINILNKFSTTLTTWNNQFKCVNETYKVFYMFRS